MNKRWLYLIIVLICLSLAGIVVVQYLWIRNAFQIRQAQFDQETNEALGSVVNKLETSENLALIQSRLISDSLMNLIRSYANDSMGEEPVEIDLDQLRAAIHRMGSTPPVFTQGSIDVSTGITFTEPSTNKGSAAYEMSFYWKMQEYHKIDSIMKIMNEQMEKREEAYHHDRQQRVEVRTSSPILVVDPKTGRTRKIYPNGETERRGVPSPGYRRATGMQGSISGKLHAVVPDPREEESRIIEEQIVHLSKRTQMLEELIQRMAIEYEEIPKNVEARIDRDNLKSILAAALTDNNIQIPFEFAVYNPQNDTNPLPIRSEHFSPDYVSTPHRVSLFPNDVFEKPDQLLLYFPNQQSFIFRSLSFLLLGSLLFTIIIIFSSGLSIYVMVRQKRVSDIKTDFINNMTHEFKTPIATISIATDSIANPKVIETPEQIRKYLRIIKEENVRMNTSVEQVLQMSFLDSRDFRLTKEPVNMQLLINRATDHFRLIVEKQKGILTTGFSATSEIVRGDESHLRNIVMNLLDNASKYSLGEPEITVLTMNRSDRFILTVTDKGVGMTPDVQKRIFDKFYRVTTGNVHNIKGFGLGLSYVKAIVLAHHGEITVSSEPGKGSRFEISLPLYHLPVENPVDDKTESALS